MYTLPRIKMFNKEWIIDERLGEYRLADRLVSYKNDAFDDLAEGLCPHCGAEMDRLIAIETTIREFPLMKSLLSTKDINSSETVHEFQCPACRKALYMTTPQEAFDYLLSLCVEA